MLTSQMGQKPLSRLASQRFQVRSGQGKGATLCWPATGSTRRAQPPRRSPGSYSANRQHSVPFGRARAKTPLFPAWGCCLSETCTLNDDDEPNTSKHQLLRPRPSSCPDAQRTAQNAVGCALGLRAPGQMRQTIDLRPSVAQCLSPPPGHALQRRGRVKCCSPAKAYDPV